MGRHRRPVDPRPRLARRPGLVYIPSMAVDPALLEILVCPDCKVPVAPVHDGAGLKCPKCHRVYPVRDDIPVMLIDEATVEESKD
jgi:uncharacterized protein